ncbi:hypothetical protein K2173_005884 [Erythroxylum novogranatense]|uniref:Uncharacterized protein n=1 Tax=Erythroxylum novogranatense TaxID=1862640 RepID=A0AAV8U366_9ROSI|nr:hypothetical protein K2173_005884 [Erythroxylum novogranatense]
MTSSFSMALRPNCCPERPSVSCSFTRTVKSTISSTLKPLVGDQLLHQFPIPFDVMKLIKDTSARLLDAFVDSAFEFVDQPVLPSQGNFAPVVELKESVIVTGNIEGRIPDDFPEGVYARNGPNPIFGGLKTSVSMWGKTSHIWVEGEGMLHVLYFKRSSDGSWTLQYDNRHVETETFKLEKQRNKPCFLPAIEGDSLAVLSAYFLNLLRFGKANKYISNTSIMKFAGKFYTTSESHIPQEIDIFTLETLGNWTVNGAWNRPFTSHPKKAPGTGELVTMGIHPFKPFMEVGVISADGKRLIHKADLKFHRCTLCHDIGVTRRYNVILDFPLTIDINRLLAGGSLTKYDKEDYARIGIMPRYGDGDSVRWFKVETSSVFHIFNCFEDGNEVVVWGCKARDSIIPGPDMGWNKSEWFSRRFKHIESVDENTNPEDGLLFARCYEWRLNMETGDTKEKYLTGTEFSMEFPFINEELTGVRNKYGYAQLIDSDASSQSGMAKYGGLAKLHFEKREIKSTNALTEGPFGEHIKVEYHKLETNTFCTGATFLPRQGGLEEDYGWVVTFVHNENTNISKVYIIDAKKFVSEPVAKITLPARVPYGFHGAFFPITFQDMEVHKDGDLPYGVRFK